MWRATSVLAVLARWLILLIRELSEGEVPDVFTENNLYFH